jgi:hypothetical protein
MIDRHMRDLRLDRRLHHRRGWISAQDLEEALKALPDAAAKGELVTEEEGASEAGSEGPAPAAPDPSLASPTPSEPLETP